MTKTLFHFPVVVLEPCFNMTDMLDCFPIRFVQKNIALIRCEKLRKP